MIIFLPWRKFHCATGGFDLKQQVLPSPHGAKRVRIWWEKVIKNRVERCLMNCMESDRLAWWNIAALWYMIRSLCQHLASPFSSSCPFDDPIFTSSLSVHNFSTIFYFIFLHTKHFWRRSHGMSRRRIHHSDQNEATEEKNDLINNTN